MPVRARVENIDGLSGHADAVGLSDPLPIFIVHGEPQPARAIQGRWDARVLPDGERIPLV